MSATRKRIAEETLAALLNTPALHDRYARALLADLVGEAVGHRADLREQATVSLQLLELFRFCTRHQDGLSALARKLQMLEPGCPQAPVVQRLAEEWAEADSLEEATQNAPAEQSYRVTPRGGQYLRRKDAETRVGAKLGLISLVLPAAERERYIEQWMDERNAIRRGEFPKQRFHGLRLVHGAVVQSYETRVHARRRVD
ncbi:effector-associated domain 2-containing protein [Streptomyces mirabilis]|uniref:effector-associated domain 2-containing protein n=1 Tax=Streptomyces mirabilis TaxID=68239 RepID=UPI0036D8D418